MFEETMYMLIGLLFFGIFLASLILPWVLFTRIQALRREVGRLNSQVAWLITYAREKGAELPEQWKQLKQTKAKELLSQKRQPEKANEAPPLPAPSPIPSKVSQKKIEEPKKKFAFTDLKKSFEQKFAMSLPVWIGGIALALSGAFFVKYSIEMGLLSPSVRLTIGGLFGIALLIFGNWIHDKPHIANGERISQALSGAGIADLYVCLFAATSFYDLIPSLAGFVGMAVVTAIAVVLSLKQGPPIAMLGMIGGFITPALIESKEPSAPLLFIYLYFVLAGLFTVIRRKNWWFISIPTVLATFAWVIFWVETSFSYNDGLWLGLFLIAVSGTIVFNSKKAIEESSNEKPEPFPLFPSLNYLSMGGAILLMSAVVTKSHFGLMEWGLFGFLAAGGIVLSYYNQKLYGFIPWISVIMNVIMLLGWQESDPIVLTSTIVAFAFLYTMSSYWLMWQALNPRSWAILAATSGLIYYVLAYAKFHNWVEGASFMTKDWYTETYLWGVIALGLFALSVFVVIHILNRFHGEEGAKQYLLTVYTLTATAFLSIGLTLELNEEFLTIALATEILAVSWINGYVTIKALRLIAGLLTILFGILMIPQILFKTFLLSNNVVAIATAQHFGGTLPPYWAGRIPSVTWSLFHLGLPALIFGMAGFLLRKQKDDFLINIFEMTAIGLITVMTYYLTRHAFHMNENLAFTMSSFIERGTLTNIYFFYGLACLWLGRKFDREALSLSGISLIALALLRILLFDLLFYNPLGTAQYIGSFPLFNGLLLSYGLPILWLSLINKEIIKTKWKKYNIYSNICSFVLLFFFISFNVTQIYHGQYLYKGGFSNAEVYTYSIAWLLAGIGLLFFGTLRQNKTLRIASLVFIMLTIGKVFLIDASELTGLFRVFSFLGLGVSLLGLSWFYTRFVFRRVR